ncbi:hypothetical protein [Acetobacter conturbans]|uniref:Uncharacterized protein n=1 Tax=Acetobacter conturbans TaxID=1737472 RepID=A0ABX0JX98_9PROT|nr:hypothetical protein [Acetobacter conturbans]NHN88112.1 hypothetical protein [Acetobacter conturbans]
MLTISLPAQAAAFDSKDVSILGETLHFVVPPPTGKIGIAVVYNEQIPGSQMEAQEVAAIFGDTNDSVSGVTMHAFAVSLGMLDKQQFVAVISAEGAGTPLLKSIINSHHAVCVTNHLDQVESGNCQLYVTSQPSVDIRLNQDATDAADVHFATAFRIMVHTL